MAKKAAKKTVNVAIEQAVHSQFSTVCKDRSVGRSMNDTATRLLAWFNEQPSKVRSAVVNDVDDDLESAYAEALQRLADSLRGRIRSGADDDGIANVGVVPQPPRKPRRSP